MHLSQKPYSQVSKILLFLSLFVALTANAQDSLSVNQPRFSTYFVESRWQLGPAQKKEFGQFNLDLGVGLQFTSLPDKWGWYASATYINSDLQGIHGGIAYRLLGFAHKIDLQFYSGLSCGFMNFFNGDPIHIRPGLDAGIRLSLGAKVKRSRFAWTSVSMGMTNYWDRPFFTFGLSLDITALMALGLLL